MTGKVKRMDKEMKKMWEKASLGLPLKQNANDPEYCNIPVTRVTFSDNRKILDIEDIAENNIRIVEKEEAEWLMEVLQRYVKGLEDSH